MSHLPPLPVRLIGITLLAAVTACQSPPTAPQEQGAPTLKSRVQVTTVTGGTEGYQDGPAASARFSYPTGLAFDPAGTLYITEQGKVQIRALSPDGTVTTVAGGQEGFADGVGTDAKFGNPMGVTAAAIADLFITDGFGSHRIRHLGPNRVVETIAGGGQGYADGKGTAAQFHNPIGIVRDAAGNLYVADANNHRIRRIDADGVVTTLAGGSKGFADGPKTLAQFDTPAGLALAPDGALYVADTLNHRIRKIAPDGTVSTLSGGEAGFHDGALAEARFNSPTGLALDGSGNLYVADGFNHAIRRIGADGRVVTLAGGGAGTADGNGDKARFHSPFDVELGPDGALYVSDQANHSIRKVVMPAEPSAT